MAPRWRDNPLKIFKGKADIPTKEEWNLWVLTSTAKLEAMEMPFFISALEALVLENNEFHALVAHPTPDTVTSDAFKKAVVTF